MSRVRAPAFARALAPAAWIAATLCSRVYAAGTDRNEIAPSSRSAQEVLNEELHPESALDRWHDRVYLSVQDFIARTDARFVGDGDTPLPVPSSPFRLGAETDAVYRQDGSVGATPRLDLDLSLQLPNLQRRLRLFITSDTVEESPSALRSASNAVRAGIRLTPLRYVDFDVGIRADAPPVAFTSLRWQRTLAWGPWEFQPLAKVYLETHQGFGIAAGASFDRWIQHWVFRSSSYANWRKDARDTELTQSLTVAHAQEIIRFGRYSDVVDGKDLARGFGLQLLVSGTHDTGVQRYEASLFFKQPTKTHWLYWHVAPLVVWERQFSWHPDPGIRIGIDALFWNVSGR